MRALHVALLLAVLAAGCFGATPPDDGTVPASTNATGDANATPKKPVVVTDPRKPVIVTDPACAFNGTACLPACACEPRASVVVAVVDSGINPYHADFAASPRLPPAGFPGAIPLPLTLGRAYADAAKSDEALWKSVQTEVLYTIPGTRILGAITMGELGTSTEPSSSLILDDVGHGTGTSSAVARNSPNADIVLVQVGSGSLDRGIAWAAAQPWIDVVSVSWGVIGNVPIGLLGDPVVDALDAAAASGKLVVVSAGNEPTPAAFGHSGSPRTISVGGSSREGKGETATASKGVDVVSDFSPVVAVHDDATKSREMYGTSFAAPTVSGALAEAWWIARDSGLDVDAQALREAMNAIAVYWQPADYTPNLDEAPVVAPCAQQGWGYVDGTMAEAIASVATGATAAASKPEAAACMGALQTLRTTLRG